MTANISRVKSCNKLNNPAGNISKELKELKELETNKSVDAIYTITVGCSGFLTLICC
ncbi:hypothetical protein acsn021_15480 [Anaerocolumna cellulosilytica]|uniref:Uncharacterized protein n=1 Tax=Anaerocolumna cellulosilytica TaxID=433286 RepID=A0A6S6QY34_9FIRM|nr:hypothetical protein [Anaerocolumna cellulosilytica]MBB5196717.1 hypothetical protein [Anaerocolumna cellulosilytica]BCJ93979.1 hypothetical protein acsn021_15480 [Anaerocolumna cellulosilytica]